MKKTNEVKQNVKNNERQFAREQKVSGCCGPTCCGGSDHKTNSERKEK